MEKVEKGAKVKPLSKNNVLNIYILFCSLHVSLVRLSAIKFVGFKKFSVLNGHIFNVTNWLLCVIIPKISIKLVMISDIPTIVEARETSNL